MRGAFLLLLTGAILGCAQATQESSLPNQASTSRQIVKPTRDAVDCAPLVRRVSMHPDSFTVLPPYAKKIYLPPHALQGLRGRLVRAHFQVDPQGHVFDASVSGLEERENPEYYRRLRASLFNYEFGPAVYDGCAVPGSLSIQIKL